MAGSHDRRAAVRALVPACVTGCALLAGLIPGSAGASKSFVPLPARGVGESGPCPHGPSRLVPSQASTFVYRIQHPWDLERLARLRAKRPLDFPLQRRDVFLVRARAVRLSEARRMVAALRDRSLASGELFRCNRILAMTGVHQGAGAPRENALNLIHNPAVWSVSPDWEQLMFDHAYPSASGGSGGPAWSSDFATNVARLRPVVRRIRQAGKLPGAIVTGWQSHWDHGALARDAGLHHQVVQTQQDCVAGAGAFGGRARDLLRQYRGAGQPAANLAMQVSFNSHPGKTGWEYDVTPRQAASCTTAAYDAGVRGFLLWGPPDALDDYFRVLPHRVRGEGCTLSGNRRRNVLRGTGRSDVICGFGGNDSIYGRSGDDVLVGGTGTDRLWGGPGRDWLRGGPGRDRLHGGPGIDLCARGVGRDILAVSCDRDPPRISGVAVSPASVDATAAPQAVTVAALAGDSGSGVARIQLRFRCTAGGPTLAATLDASDLLQGTPHAGLYAGALHVPARTEPCVWRLDRVQLTDAAGNTGSVDATALHGAGVRASFAVLRA